MLCDVCLFLLCISCRIVLIILFSRILILFHISSNVLILFRNVLLFCIWHIFAISAQLRGTPFILHAIAMLPAFMPSFLVRLDDLISDIFLYIYFASSIIQWFKPELCPIVVILLNVSNNVDSLYGIAYHRDILRIRLEVAVSLHP